MQHDGIQPVRRRRAAGTRSIGKIAFLGVVLAFSPRLATAGTTGKISGRVVDKQKKQPVVAATIAVVSQPFGAFSNAQGQYNIINVPPGVYEVKIGRVGFKPMTVQEIVVSADNTTSLDAELEETTLTTETVVVRATRPPVEIRLTSTRVTLGSQQIESLPVQELQDVVNLQAGVVDGHFRGGRLGEVQYQVDGVSVNNAFDNKSSLRVDRSLLQEVQVISGTFDAEYGQAMSGVVNAILKTGTERFQWESEVYGGDFVFPGRAAARLTPDELRPAALQSYQLTLTGPLGLPKTVFLLSGRHSTADDYVYGQRKYLPTDNDRTTLTLHPTGDGAQMPLGYARESSGALKLTNTSIAHAKLHYQVLFDVLDGRRSNYWFRYNPDGLSTQHTTSIAHGFDWTQTLSQSTYLDVSLRQNYTRYHDYVYEDVYDPRYDAAGPPVEYFNYIQGAYLQGVDFTRWEQKTNAYLLKSTLVSQMSHEQQLKGGFELQWPEVAFGTPGWLAYRTIDGVQRLVRYANRPPDFPGMQTYYPVIGAAFLQDQLEFNDLTLRAGARLDYFDARATTPSDPANPTNAIAGAPLSVPKRTTRKAVVSPRLGVAYPITQRSAIHFAYGHFYQFPAIGQLFSNADYSILARLQAGGTDYGVLGNPDVRPEKSVQYEFGYKHALTEDLGFDVSLFYKDIRDLLGTEFIDTYSGAQYGRLTNVDFGNVIGFTIAVDHRRLGPASLALDYTWQLAQGDASDPHETATRAAAGQDPRPRVVPFGWDQRHTFNMTLAFAKPDVYSVSGILRLATGQPYTPVLETGFGNGLEDNSGHKPSGLIVDLRGERRLGVRGLGMSLFARVFNLFDTRFFNGAVFNSTGSPYYSRFPVEDVVGLRDPTRFYPPRRLEVGTTLKLELPGRMREK